MESIQGITDQSLIDDYGKFCGYMAQIFVKKSNNLNQEDAQDFAQDALLKLVKISPAHRAEPPYIKQAIVNSVITSWRKRCKDTSPIPDEALAELVKPLSGEEESVRSTLANELDDALSTFMPGREKLGRILYEMRPLYRKMGPGSIWSEFLRAKGLPPRTATDYIHLHEIKIGVRVISPPKPKERVVSDDPKQMQQMELAFPVENLIELRENAYFIAKQLGKERIEDAVLWAVKYAAQSLRTPAPADDFQESRRNPPILQ